MLLNPSWTIVLGVACGGCLALAGVMAVSLGEEWLGQILQATLYRRRERWRQLVRRQFPTATPGQAPGILSEDELLDLPAVHSAPAGHCVWRVVQIAAGAIGVGVGYLVLAETTPEMAVVGVVAALLPRFLLRLRAGAVRWRHRLAIRNFLTLLRLSISLGETLSRALEDVAGRSGEDLFARRLRHHLDSRVAGQPLPILEALAADFRSPDLEALVLRVEAAQRGGATLEEAVAVSAREIETRMLEEARLSVQQAEPQLLLPMMAGLFFPAMYLVLYPLGAFILAGLNALPT